MLKLRKLLIARRNAQGYINALKWFALQGAPLRVSAAAQCVVRNLTGAPDAAINPQGSGETT